MVLRTCVGCHRRAGTEDLVRIVFDGQYLSVSASSAGRGVWLHRESPNCLSKARTSRAFERGFKAAVPAEAIEEFAQCLSVGNARPQGVRG